MRLELAMIFTDMLRADGKAKAALTTVQSVAARFVAYLGVEKVDTVEKLDILVTAAYAENKWTRRQGRPKAGDKPAPSVVQVYVSTVRKALALKLKLASYKNMEEIRRAIREKTPTVVKRVPPELKGVIVTGESLNGGLYHDVLRVRALLTEDEQQALDAVVRKAYERFVKKAPPDLRLVA
jgi:hypothetical protein